MNHSFPEARGEFESRVRLQTKTSRRDRSNSVAVLQAFSGRASEGRGSYWLGGRQIVPPGLYDEQSESPPFHWVNDSRPASPELWLPGEPNGWSRDLHYADRRNPSLNAWSTYYDGLVWAPETLLVFRGVLSCSQGPGDWTEVVEARDSHVTLEFAVGLKAQRASLRLSPICQFPRSQIGTIQTDYMTSTS